MCGGGWGGAVHRLKVKRQRLLRTTQRVAGKVLGEVSSGVSASAAARSAGREEVGGVEGAELAHVTEWGKRGGGGGGGGGGERLNPPTPLHPPQAVP